MARLRSTVSELIGFPGYGRENNKKYSNEMGETVERLVGGGYKNVNRMR